MYNIILAHQIVVTIFLLHYLVKLLLLLVNKKQELATYSKITRIPEILISVTFLVTGIWLLINESPLLKALMYYAKSGEWGDQPLGVSGLMKIKLLCVFAAIPLAVVGFKKGNKALATLSVVLILAAYGLAEVNKKIQGEVKVDTSAAIDPIEKGKIVYQNATCIGCHGADGKLGLSGAKDLSITTLTVDEQKAIIKNGKSPMPGYKDLTDEQLNDVIEYISTFRK